MARTSPATGAGQMLRLVRDGRASTRADLVELTGMARSTVAQRLDQLVSHGFLYPAGESASTGGRRPTVFAFNESAGVVLAADLGATHSRVAVTDLSGAVLAEHAEVIEISMGPEAFLDWLEARFDALLGAAGRSPADVWGVGVGVPGPVEFATGRPANPPIMPGWDGYGVADRLQARYGVPALVDNDVNIMALGEHVRAWRDADHLLFVKVGTGIGAGVVAEGRIHRGAQGAAGDIGHIRVTGEDALCRCGNTGCLEAVAGGAAMAAALRAQGLDAHDSREVVALVRAGEPAAIRVVRDAGRVLGEALAAAVNLFNPSVLVVGGDVAEAHEQLLAGIREAIYQRSLPLATRHLKIARSTLEDRAGVIGAAVMVIDHLLAPEAVDQAVAAR